MMKIALCVAVVFFTFNSCTKINFTEYRKNPGIDLRFCNIQTWTDTHGDETRKNVFTYDVHGNPLSVVSDQHGTGNGAHFFTYDEFQRLIKYEYELVQTKNYQYEGMSRRASGAEITDVFGRELLETYTYDDKGRIIKSVLELVSSPFEDEEFPTETKEYVYLNDDLNSILVNGSQVNPDVTYSSKPSVYMSNKVWKFVNQNYSKHSVSGIATSNFFGLPLTFKAEDYEFPFLDIEGRGSTITYHCW
jgi:hypothetical protein